MGVTEGHAGLRVGLVCVVQAHERSEAEHAATVDRIEAAHRWGGLI